MGISIVTIWIMGLLTYLLLPLNLQVAYFKAQTEVAEAIEPQTEPQDLKSCSSQEVHFSPKAEALNSSNQQPALAKA